MNNIEIAEDANFGDYFYFFDENGRKSKLKFIFVVKTKDSLLSPSGEDVYLLISNILVKNQLITEHKLYIINTFKYRIEKIVNKKEITKLKLKGLMYD